MIKFRVDSERCTKCGLCIADCPSRIIRTADDGVPAVPREDAPKCIRCQHCLAICPTAAVSVLGLDPGDSQPLAGLPTGDQVALLLRARRTVRCYRDENVPAEKIDELLRTTANAPSGVNLRRLTFRVIRDRTVMQALREQTIAGLEAAEKEGRIPDHFAYLKAAPPAWREHGADIIFRGAPHALIMEAGAEALCPTEDAIIALSYFELLAQSHGLGTVWWGMLKMLLAVLPELGTGLGLNPKSPYCYGMLFGVPAVQYKRTVQRDDANVATIEL